ncbi:MAG: tRNA (N(6)-L-threonylcarbamoyladenosine(37)-C(2))-methylthiotransferase MtaB [Clostridiaceae bacterium]|nr:tRNA (N(6)-L-threonylcarbamoyladenosine(37)-C(2))-methylthiotransferase MtaB [Clostridiaceae bacterium]MBW4859640.1 tRNA (N(6)-L-threonylcarbamoyladenosine(37)-C(2))-methylthiotransferase MtaB [Clostridiaceae bacterium]MBW4868609.1 tRNA (N(6)-L-threonylcarbamoyladenosine(37)-C(2))-methylthiotransferase MtaB [Clostridiaceae bacterium]
MKTVAFYTLGCKVNQYETEAMEEIFQKEGYKVVNPKESADIYVINTCTVTNLGDRKSRQFIRRAKKTNKDSTIAVVGCYAQVSPDEIEKIEGVDVIIGTSDKEKIVRLCKEARKNNIKINKVKDFRELKDFEELKIEDLKSKTRAYMKIQEGCNQYCSYCIIPYARGPIRSRPLENIIKEGKRLSEVGFKEIILTGIHVASYGKDRGDYNLLDVIKEINKIEGIERIRLSSIEPTLIDENFMKTITKMPKVCDHFHLSLQSGSDKILDKMNRKYTTDEYRKTVHLIREYMPYAGITTDIIVGFPGEGEEEFKETYDFVKEIGFSRIHVFKYSPRSGTPASKFKEQVHGSIKSQRSEKLIELGEELMKEFNKKLIGKSMTVLFEEESKNSLEYMEGYTTNYTRVRALGNSNIEGKILPVKIIGIDKENLIGEIEEF